MSMTRFRRRRDEGGAAAVEFALLAPIVLLLVFGIIQYGLYF
jgi:Flp pilus assembly protein TadG